MRVIEFRVYFKLHHSCATSGYAEWVPLSITLRHSLSERLGYAMANKVMPLITMQNHDNMI